jgi:hypothetical protein
MNVQEQIKKYITSQREPKRSDMRELHRLTLQVSPECRLWFFDGKDSKDHTVSNPTIGYGFHTIKYANGKSREFFQIGVSGNKTGISVYILGLKDKKYLAKTYGKKLGKASVTGYCIRFKTLKDINIETLEAALRYGLAAQNVFAVAHGGSLPDAEGKGAVPYLHTPAKEKNRRRRRCLVAECDLVSRKVKKNQYHR